MTKPTKWLCAQRRLGSAWASAQSESSLSAWRKLGSLATHWSHSKNSDQTGQMPRLISFFAGHTIILLVCPDTAHMFFQESPANGCFAHLSNWMKSDEQIWYDNSLFFLIYPPVFNCTMRNNVCSATLHVKAKKYTCTSDFPTLRRFFVQALNMIKHFIVNLKKTIVS